MSRLASSKTAQDLGRTVRLGRTIQCSRRASVPRAALRSALGYLLLPLWGGRIDPSPPPDFPWTSPGSLRGISFPLDSFDALHSHFGSSTIFGQADIQDSTSNDFPTT